jgi:hypothetical protein
LFVSQSPLETKYKKNSGTLTKSDEVFIPINPEQEEIL